MWSDLRTRVKKFGKRLPPLAWRDEQIRVLRDYTSVLRSEVKRLGGTVPSPPSRAAARRAPQTLEQQVSLVRSSGLFDESWYAGQLDATAPAPHDLVEHYLTTGHREGLSATPAFAEEWYRSKLSGHARSEPPLLHYLTTPSGVDLSPHPAFPHKEYVAAHPESLHHPGGPLGHYLSPRGSGSPSVDSAVQWLPSDEFLVRAREAALWVWETRGHEHLPRQSESFDREAEQKFKQSLLTDPSLLAAPATVTVILPTKDRAVRLRAAISSVQAQTYDAWELVVVDDGSVEDIESVVAEYAFDPRISYIRHSVNRGVAAARNTGLRAATGAYIAYLDSDNTWELDFLELMMRHIERTGAPVAYCATALIEEGGLGRQLYRGMPFSRAALRERNYIDCIVVVHERALLERVGGFDEDLRRTVDWDLLIRLANVADFSYAPFVGSIYDLWEEGGDRITTDVAEGYRFRVRERTLVNWDAARAALPSRGDHLSVVIAGMQPVNDLILVVERLLDTTTAELEVVVVDNHRPDGESILLHTSLAPYAQVRLHRLPQRLTPELARNVGIAASSGHVVVVMHDRIWTYRGWEHPLISALDEHVAVQPLVLAQSGAIFTAGISFSAEGKPHHAYAGFAGDAPELRGILEADGVSSACVAVRADDLVSIEGFDPLYMRDDVGPELSLRLRERSGGSVASVGASHVAFIKDPPAPKNRTAVEARLQNATSLSDLWNRTGLTALPEYKRSGFRVERYERNGSDVASFSPLLVHDRPSRPLRWALKIGIYSVTDRDNWGDWHFAQALRDSLERLGHEVTIDTRDAWYRPTAALDDVTLVLQGRGRFVPTPGQLSAVWVFSHPSEAPTRALSEFDLVFGASQRWCRQAASASRRPPQHLMQCTDPERFRPTPPDPQLAHNVLMIGNARGMRPSVQASLEAGIVPSVYGKKWEGLLPPGAWKGDYVPNELLPHYYASAGVVLNDHWDDMREWGLISNRVFDAAACGARIVSDQIDGIHDTFGDVVLTYTSPEELRLAVETHLHEDQERAERRNALAEQVRTLHSFDARALTLSNEVMEALAQRQGQPSLKQATR